MKLLLKAKLIAGQQGSQFIATLLYNDFNLKYQKYQRMDLNRVKCFGYGIASYQ